MSVAFRSRSLSSLSLAGAAAAVSVSLLGGLAPAQAATTSPDPTLTSKIASVLNVPAVTQANVGVVVTDGVTGERIYSSKDTMLLSTASNEKMITAMAAFDTLGVNYTFPTKVYLSSKPVNGVVYGNVYVKGSGDPTLSVSDLKTMAANLKAAGVTKVTGRVIADATVFDDVRYNSGWLPNLYSDSDCSQVAGLTLMGPNGANTATIQVNYTGKTSGAAPTLWVTPAEASDYVSLVNKATTSGSSDTLLTNRASAGSNVINVTGKVPVGTTYRNNVAIDNPALLTVHVLKKTMAAAGITVGGGIGTGAVPTIAVLQQTHQSAPLAKLLAPVIKDSNNTEAEQVFKAVGAATSAQGSWTSGASAVRAMAAKAGVDPSTLTLVDGSGEAYATKVQAASLNKLEMWARNQSWWTAFYNDLAVGGVDGTLVTRFKGTAAQGNVHAKTGTLGDLTTKVTALSGYVSGADGRPYVFTAISNYTGTSPKSTVDQVVVTLANWTKK